MALKSFNPYTASRRFITMLDKSEVTKQTPEKSLVEPRKRTGGRNSHGEVTAFFSGNQNLRACCAFGIWKLSVFFHD